MPKGDVLYTEYLIRLKATSSKQIEQISSPRQIRFDQKQELIKRNKLLELKKEEIKKMITFREKDYISLSKSFMP